MTRRKKLGAPVQRARRRKRARPPAQKLGLPGYRQVWRMVEGAVADAMNCHPGYFVEAGAARTSITKRVTGAIIGYLARPGRASGDPGG